MATFAERLRSLRQEKGWSQQRLADNLKLSKSSVNMYERGEREPGFETMEAIADLFNVDMNYLYGRTDVKIADPIVWDTDSSLAHSPIPPGFDPMPDMDTVPLVGRIACGTPITAEQNTEGMVCVPSSWRATFTLICRGSSMEPRIHDGDLVAIRSQEIVETGEIAAVRIGEEATLKRVYYDGTTLTLMPANAAFAPMIFTGPQLEEVHIEGRVVGWTHWVG